MVRLIQPDADELADGPDTWTDSWRACDARKRTWIDLTESSERVGQQGAARDVRHDAGQASDRTVRIENAGLLLAGSPITQQFHVSSRVGEVTKRSHYV